METVEDTEQGDATYDATEETPTTARSAPAAAAPASGRSRLVPVLGVLLALAVGAVALVWLQGGQARDDAALSEAEAQATQVAEDVIVRMTTYDAETVDEDFTWVSEVGTSKFEREQTVTTEQLIPVIKRTGAQAEGTVQRAAATATDEDTVSVLLFVDQVLGRTGTRQTSLDRTRVEMTMVRSSDGDWLVDEIELF